MFKNILNYFLIFIIVFLGTQLLFGQPQSIDTSIEPITFTTSKKQYALGKVVQLNITNNLDQSVVFVSSCPKQPFSVFKQVGTTNTPVQSIPQIDCLDSSDSNVKDIRIAPHATKSIRYTYWSNELFQEYGQYIIGTTIQIDNEPFQIYSNSFNITKRGFWSNLWLKGFYQPMYNILVWTISMVPQANLGLAIVLLTLAIRLILYIPNQKALVAQRRMTDIQPKLNAIKEKYKDNQTRMAEETMKIWKENKVNPASSCLPILIQFPVLIALFHVVQDGLNPDKTWLLYSFLKDFDLSTITVHFLGLDLLKRNILILPLVIGVLQFTQLKLSFVKPASDAKSNNDMQGMMQSTMLYFMPAMIAVFTMSLPAGIGVYWGTSTLFAIVQQLIVNKTKPQTNTINKNDIRVIDVNEVKD